MSFDVDVVVVGAGVIGLATARALARGGQSVLIIERNSRIGAETSSRNSEVIHAGIYYAPGSLKAECCVSGRSLLYEFCDRYGVSFQRCGKLVVATSSSQEARLIEIAQAAAANGVHDIKWMSSVDVRALEPEVRCTAALFSPSSGIVDSQGLMLAFLGDAERYGASLALHTPVEHISVQNNGFKVHTGGTAPTEICSRYLVNAAGLSASSVARRIDGLSQEFIPETYYAKGSYFLLNGKSPFERLIYPVPEPGGLGIHFTLDLAGRGKFGPDVEWVDSIDLSVDERRAEQFYSTIRSYWPKLSDSALSPAFSGIRPKISRPGSVDMDFMIQGPGANGVPGLFNCFGIESPGLTSSLAIAAKLAGEIIES